MTTERMRVQCPVCSRIVAANPRGTIRSHGNKSRPTWEQCSKVGRNTDVREWEVDERGVRVAPAPMADALWDVRSVIEHWAPDDLHRQAIDRLAALLRAHWDELNGELIRERKQRRAAVTRARKVRDVDAESVRRVIAPAVARVMEEYPDPDQITRAVAEALMEWLEEDR